MNATPPARPERASLSASASQMIGRFFFAMAAGAALLSSMLLGVLPTTPKPAWQAAAVVACVGFAAVSAIAARLSGRADFARGAALGTIGLAAIVLCGLVSVALGDGLRSPGIGFAALVVCIVSATGGIGVGLGLGAAATIGMAFLAWAEHRGLIGPSPASTPLALVLSFQWLLVACGWIGGSLIARVLRHYLDAAAEREQRFRGLLRIAADWYWEQDRQFRYTYLSDATDGRSGFDLSSHLRRAPWQISDMGLSDEQLDAHRADLESHQPFSGLLARRRDASGRRRIVSLSGEPRFDSGGVFLGYWGVGRDVTDEVHAQRSMTASELRYRELFTRSPSPLFLHRRGIVFDANESAARLFGFADATAMNNFDIVNLFPAGEPRDRAIERIRQLEAMTAGEALPVADFQIHAIDGQPLSVQATAVRVDTSSGPANLSIFYDITARQAVEVALRRSEAMLSHLFATSPDCITLTEMATGRHALVNPAFCRLTGFTSAEVVGRTAADLGLWHQPQQFERLLEQLDRDGRVLDMPTVFVAKSGALVSMLLAAGRFVMDGRDYLVINARDVTESERTRLQHAAILERASIGIAFTRESLFVQANPYFERMFGWGPGELAGQPGEVVWASEADYAEIGALAGPLLAAGEPFEVERRMRRRDDSEFWCRLLAQAVDRNDPSHGGTIWIAEDVTERRRLDEALAAARDAAEAASRAKSAFLANTSHEIRTPLNGLLGLTRLAMQEDLVDSRRQQYLEQILDSAQSLAGIMSDILDVSKIEAGKIALEDSPFDLRASLVAVHHAYHALAAAKGLELRLAIDPDLPPVVRGDAVRVRQILSNFISNALKFTERGHVCLEAVPVADGALRLAVSDTGPGVSAEMQQRLFTPFSQGDTSTTRRYGGTGLGLSICRELAQLMGGSVGVDSAVGRGSTFWAELPLPRAEPDQPPGTGGEAEDLERLRGALVLMAEDNPVNMMIAVAMLEQWGVEVVQATDGQAAIDAVHAAARHGRPFDAVLMDVQMPVLGGHDAARELRRHYGRAELPIIALTAAALVSEREESVRAGMDDFLTKPIDAPRLRRSLARHLRRTSPA
jgi:PAS domain S-box-containing protein